MNRIPVVNRPFASKVSSFRVLAHFIFHIFMRLFQFLWHIIPDRSCFLCYPLNLYAEIDAAGQN